MFFRTPVLSYNLIYGGDQSCQIWRRSSHYRRHIVDSFFHRPRNRCSVLHLNHYSHRERDAELLEALPREAKRDPK